MAIELVRQGIDGATHAASCDSTLVVVLQIDAVAAAAVSHICSTTADGICDATARGEIVDGSIASGCCKVDRGVVVRDATGTRVAGRGAAGLRVVVVGRMENEAGDVVWDV